MNFVEAELYNESLCNIDPEPDPDDDLDDDHNIEPDPDDDVIADGNYGQDPPLYDDRGLTAAGYELLAEMDRQGEFV